MSMFKHTNILEGKQEKEAEKASKEMMDENVYNLLSNTNLHIQEAQQTLSRINVNILIQPHHYKNSGSTPGGGGARL